MQLACKLRAACLLTMLQLSAAESWSQVVQLPSMHYFATETSVLVPDRGQTALDGIGNRSSSQSQFGGLPGNRGRGAAGQAAGAGVTAFVHDFDAWDQQLLAAAAARRKPSALAGEAAHRTSEAAPPTSSVAEIDAWRLAAQSNQEREAEVYFARARQAQIAGQQRVARVYYQMAARRAGGELKSQSLAQITAIDTRLGADNRTTPR